MTEHPKPPRPLDRHQLLEKALRLLGTQDYALAEIQRKLLARAESSFDVDWVVAKLQEAGFLNDARVAQQKALLARDQRLLGQRRVRQELNARLIQSDAADAAVQAAYQNTDEALLALQFLRSKMAPFLGGDRLEDPKQLQRAYGRLRRAGFTHAHTVQALKQHSRLASTLDDLGGDEPDD